MQEGHIYLKKKNRDRIIVIQNLKPEILRCVIKL